ncbi:hypothetical protein P4361_03090 [Fictibacillus sp. B-59209]|uniref:hypothetical protein n=1 Tax=Fictibacillus sp. B-59209 TaxID=3024873 RepID=UPI002E1A7816|nr:hypothetical protein [Fictibacillus sp. B-59209]
MKKLSLLLIIIAFISMNYGSAFTYGDYVSTSQKKLFSVEFKGCTPHDNSNHDDEENNNRDHDKCDKEEKPPKYDDKKVEDKKAVKEEKVEDQKDKQSDSLSENTESTKTKELTNNVSVQLKSSIKPTKEFQSKELNATKQIKE